MDDINLTGEEFNYYEVIEILQDHQDQALIFYDIVYISFGIIIGLLAYKLFAIGWGSK